MLWTCGGEEEGNKKKKERMGEHLSYLVVEDGKSRELLSYLGFFKKKKITRIVWK